MKKEELWTYGGVKGVRITLEAGEDMGSHSTPGKVFIACCEGRGTVSLPDRHISLREGDVLEVDPGIPHSVKAEDRLVLYLTVFAGKG